MKGSKITGWQDVFSFTFVQAISEKSTKISIAIICTLILLAVPITSLIKDKVNKDDQKSNISTIYLVDDTSFANADYSTIVADNKKYAEVKFVKTDKSVDELTNTLLDKEKNAVIIQISEENSAFMMHFIKNPNGKVKDKDLNSLTEIMKARFEDIRIQNLNMTQVQHDMAYAEVTTDVYVADQTGAKAASDKESSDKNVSGNEIGFLYTLAVLPVFFLISTGAMVASSIVTEKASKAIEYLMISVRPLAIVSGKVLAMLCVMLVQFAFMGISYFASTILSKIIFNETIGFSFKQLITPQMKSNLTVGNILLIVLIYLFGFLFYSTFASLFGATVSKIEELQEGLSVYTITALVGFYLAYFLIGSSAFGQISGIFAYVVCLLPISAPFIVPAFLLLGKISVLVALGSLAIQIVVFILLTIFVSKVYETLILHSGNRLKVKDLIMIFKNA